MDALIFNTLRRVQAEADEGRRAELMVETNAQLARHFLHNKQDMEELAFDLFNQAFADVQPGDLTRTLIEVKTVGLGDTDYVEEDLRGMRAYFQGKGGQILSDVIRYERSQMPREELVTAIDMHWDEVQLDFWGMITKLKAQAQEKMRSAPAHRLIELIRESVTGGATFGTFPAATFTAAQFDPILDAIALRSTSVSIFGTNAAIRKMANIGLDWGPNIVEQIFRSGIIGVYKGYPVLQMENWENFEGEFVLPNNELFIIGKNAGRVTWYGDTPKVQQLNLPSFYLRWEQARDIGMLLYGVAKGRIGRVVLT